MNIEPLVPLWLPTSGLIYATAGATVVLIVYAFLFPWWTTEIGRTAFAMKASLFLALVFTIVGLFGFWHGLWIVDTLIYYLIGTAQFWRTKAMLWPKDKSFEIKKGDVENAQEQEHCEHDAGS